MQETEGLSLKALTPEDLARVLSAAGPEVTPDTIREFVGQGCPTNEDGTLDFMVFGAWLVRELRGA
jgi:hypothetical protein